MDDASSISCDARRLEATKVQAASRWCNAEWLPVSREVVDPISIYTRPRRKRRRGRWLEVATRHSRVSGMTEYTFPTTDYADHADETHFF